MLVSSRSEHVPVMPMPARMSWMSCIWHIQHRDMTGGLRTLLSQAVQTTSASADTTAKGCARSGSLQVKSSQA